MADYDDTTGAPLSRRVLLHGAPALVLTGPDRALPSEGRGLALLDELLPALQLPMDDPRFDAADAAFTEARRRLYALRPDCLGDAVAKLLTVALAGGEHTTPGDVGMIADAVDYLTAGSPHLRRPAVVAEAMRYARMAYPGG